MNKLTGLSKLSNAYWELRKSVPISEDVCEAMMVLEDMFGRIRRSLRIEDLKPQPRDVEGLNGRMPVHF
jgi:hypothetical protein